MIPVEVLSSGFKSCDGREFFSHEISVKYIFFKDGRPGPLSLSFCGKFLASGLITCLLYDKNIFRFSTI